MLSVSEFSSQICLAVKRYILNSSSSLIFKVVSLCEGFNILEKKKTLYKFRFQKLLLQSRITFIYSSQYMNVFTGDKLNTDEHKMQIKGGQRDGSELKRLLLQGTQVQFPPPTGWLMALCNFSLWRMDALFCPLWALTAHCTKKYIQARQSSTGGRGIFFFNYFKKQTKIREWYLKEAMTKTEGFQPIGKVGRGSVCTFSSCSFSLVQFCHMTGCVHKASTLLWSLNIFASSGLTIYTELQSSFVTHTTTSWMLPPSFLYLYLMIERTCSYMATGDG